MSKPMSEQMQKVAARYEKATGKKFGQKTNADHIRSLGDEEMASCMAAFSFCPPDIEEDKLCYKDADCNECFMNWLKQPYGGDT